MRKLLLFFCFIPVVLFGSLLKQNLEKAKPGDYVVIAQGKTYTLFHIFNVQDKILTVEEISIPSNCYTCQNWSEWHKNGSPQNTSWIQYQINLKENSIGNYYSLTKQSRFTLPEADNFFATLLKLNLEPIPLSMRRKIGPPQVGGARNFWQPKMVVNGQVQEGVLFNAYQTIWPKDGGPISGKLIEIYLPQASDQYPSYFPYWLQAKGTAGQANVRVIDSGSLK